MKNLTSIEFFKADCDMYRGAYDYMADEMISDIRRQGYGWDICTTLNDMDTYYFVVNLEDVLPVKIGKIPEDSYYKISFKQGKIIDRRNISYPLSATETMFGFKIQTMPCHQDIP